MEDIFKEVQDARTIAIGGHMRPDGDCTGSCLALYQYLMKYYNGGRDKVIGLYLEPVPGEFTFLKGADQIETECDPSLRADLFIALDCGSPDRLGAAMPCFENAKRTICIDHHISNTRYAMLNLVVPEASSTAEVLFDLMDPDKIDRGIAECLYLGIIHDTGVFKHSNTSRKTMQAAGILMEKGIDFSRIIDETFYQKTYLQNQILGRCLLESIRALDGRVILSGVGRKVQEFYGVGPGDLDGIIDQLRVTKGVEVAILLKEEEQQVFKVSMRSNGVVNVSKIAVYFGGGGHIRAAGCTMSGSAHDVINNLLLHIESQLNMADAGAVSEDRHERNTERI